jgi:hypothetical protein
VHHELTHYFDSPVYAVSPPSRHREADASPLVASCRSSHRPWPKQRVHNNMMDEDVKSM